MKPKSIENTDHERAIELYERSIAAGNKEETARNLENLIKKTNPEKSAELYKKSEATKNESQSGKDKFPENTDEISIDGGTRASRWENLRKYLIQVIKVADENSDKLADLGSEAEDIRNANLKLTDVVQALSDLANQEHQREISLILNDTDEGVVKDARPPVVKVKEYSVGGAKCQNIEKPTSVNALPPGEEPAEQPTEESETYAVSEKSAAHATGEAPEAIATDALPTNAPDTANESSEACKPGEVREPNTFTVDEFLDMLKRVSGVGPKTKTYQKIENYFKDQEKKGIQTSIDFSSEARGDNDINGGGAKDSACNGGEPDKTDKTDKTDKVDKVSKTGKPIKAGEENEQWSWSNI